MNVCAANKKYREKAEKQKAAAPMETCTFIIQPHFLLNIVEKGIRYFYIMYT